MKTDDLIRQLAQEARPRAGADSPERFLGKWFVAASVAVALWLSILPFRPDLVDKSRSWTYWTECLLWLALALVAGLAVYKSRLPGLKANMESRGVLALGLILAVFIFSRFSGTGIAAEALQEMSLHRGRCGPLIFTMGGTFAAAMAWWASRGAPTKLGRTGAWVALSSGCLASFAMQVVCGHDNTLHLLLWHGLPIALLGGLGVLLGRKLLRW